MPNQPSKDIQQAVKQALPNWEIVETQAAQDAGGDTRTPPRPRARAAASPDLAAFKKKYAASDADRPTAKRAPAGKKKHAHFVKVRPSNLPDSAKPFQKVVLVKDKKVIAVQG